jgi:GntR family transcriptional regulator, sialic acid-inducible nan operon repressor
MPAERDLMDAFGVGRPVVREAMQRLAGLGMITIQHGERARLGRLDLDSMLGQIDLPARHLLSSSVRNIAHLHEARVFLEAGLAGMAAEHAADGDLDRLREAFEDMQRKVDTEEFVLADMAFHVEIARISGNPILLATCRAVLQWMADYGRDMLRTRTRLTTLADHQRILERIVARDPAGAAQAIRDHLART